MLKSVLKLLEDDDWSEIHHFTPTEISLLTKNQNFWCSYETQISNANRMQVLDLEILRNFHELNG